MGLGHRCREHQGLQNPLQVLQTELIGRGKIHGTIDELILSVVMFFAHFPIRGKNKEIFIVVGGLGKKDLSHGIQEAHRIGMPVLLHNKTHEWTDDSTVYKFQFLETPDYVTRDDKLVTPVVGIVLTDQEGLFAIMTHG